jgi:hypothetical protein
MQCRACGADVQFLVRVAGWRSRVGRCLSLAPIQCRHCFQVFYVPARAATASELKSAFAPKIARGEPVIVPFVNSLAVPEHRERRWAA